MYVLSVAILAQALPIAVLRLSQPLKTMPSVPAIPAPKSDKEQVVFYRRKWKDSQVETETKNDIIETKNKRIEQLANQKADDLKAIKYLL